VVKFSCEKLSLFVVSCKHLLGWVMPGRAAALMTEYRRSYQPSQFRCAATTYFNNREFRIQQLQRFQNHSADPFIWPDDDDDEECCADDVTVPCNETAAGGGRALFEPAHQYRHRQLKSQYERRVRGTEAQDVDRQPPPTCNSDHKDYSSRSSQEQHDDSGCSSSTEDDDHSSVVHVVGPSQRDDSTTCRESMSYVLLIKGYTAEQGSRYCNITYGLF